MASPTEGSDVWKAQDKGPLIVSFCWAITGISTLFVAGRLYVRGWMWKQLQVDDYFVTAALICAYLATALATVAVSYGNGKHASLLTTHQLERTSFYTLLSFCPGLLAFGLPKLAVIHLLTRLLNPSKKHKWFLWWLGIWSMLSLLATCGFLLGRCYPAESLWNFSIQGTCVSKTVLVDFSFYAAGLSAFVDVYLAVYPMVVLYKLQMNKKKKLALCGTLGLGSISAVVAAYKTTRITSLLSADFSYDTADLVIWTIAEGGIIIIACSIPVLQPLLDVVFKHNPLNSSKIRSRTSHYQQYGDYSRKTNPAGKIDHTQYHKQTVSRKRGDLSLTISDGESHFVPMGVTSVGTPNSHNFSSDDRSFDLEKNEDTSNSAMNGIRKTQIFTVTFSDKVSEKNEA